MNNEIKSFNQLNSDEHFVLDMFRQMKMECDKARFQLWSYELNDLLNSYQKLQHLRENIQEKYFAMLEKIDESEFANVEISYEKWNEIRDSENTNWNEEAEVISQFKYHLDDLLIQISDGTIEQKIITAEKNIEK